MKEEDIDSIFREGLQKSKAPVFDSDWENFQKLQSRKGNSWGKYFLPLLMIMILVSGTAYFYFADSNQNIEGQHQVGVNGNIEKTNIENPLLNDETPNRSEIVSDGDKVYTDSILNATDESVGQDQIIKAEDVNAEVSEAETAELEKRKNKKEIADTIAVKKAENKHQDSDHKKNQINEVHRATSEVSTVNTGKPVEQEKPFEREQSGANSEKDGRTGLRSNERASGDVKSDAQVEFSAESSDKKGNPEIISGSDSSLDRSRSEGVGDNVSALGAFQPVLMASLPANSLPVSLNENSFSAEEKPVSMVHKNHQISVYFGVEQNNILGTSPLIGVLSSWTMNRWKLGVGVGYQRSGALNWNQVSRRTIYGFDKYESSLTLQTRSVDMLSLPLTVSRQIGGVSSVFLGITPSILVNARQELLISDDSNLSNFIPETGYLYKTEAPEIIYFISGGYTHHLTTWWSLDIGGNYTFQEWRTTNKVPVGAFIRTHIRIR